jgi:uroporphyrinogen decarboxylase
MAQVELRGLGWCLLESTGRERIAAALHLDRADRAPVSAWGHTYEREWSVDELATTTVGIARRCDLDFVKLQVRASCFAETFGAAWRFSGSASLPPGMEQPGGQDAEAWRRIAASEPDGRILAEQVQVMAAVTKELGPETPCLQTVFSPGMVAWFLAGSDIDVLRLLLRAEPDLMAAGLARISETMAWFARESISAGAAGLFYAINPLANEAKMAPDEYERILLPFDRLTLAGAEGAWFNMLHLCGPNVNTALIEALRPSCVNWSIHDAGNPALAEMRNRHHVAVAGGLHRDKPIRTGTVEEVRREASDAMRQTSGRGHLLTPGCSVSPWPVDREENIRAVAEAATAA